MSFFQPRIRSWHLLPITAMAWLCLVGFVLLPVHNNTSTAQYSATPLNNEKYLQRGIDGPYLFKKRNKIREVRVLSSTCDKGYEIEELTYNSDRGKTFKCVVENKERDVFTFQLRDKISPPKSKYKQPDKLLALSDIEGNFNAFYSLLVGNGVMDKSYSWTFGEGHLVLVGDFVDRGKNVTQCLWLIYKLEQEAEEAGGMVHYILGNHETMNLTGHVEYVDNKYLALASHLSGKEDKCKAYKYLMSDKRELIRWMKSKNVIERIGKTIFVHGGLSKELTETRMSIGEINSFIRSNMGREYFVEESESNLQKFLMGPLGPLWYRGLMGRYKKMYHKATEKELNTALRYFNADNVVIGHTVVNNVSWDYDGKVYRTDINFPISKFTGKAQALFIEKGSFYRVNDFGERVLLSAE